MADQQMLNAIPFHTSARNDLEASGATLDELDDAFAHVEALDQYDERGAIVRMSAHERTFACGRLDHEFTADDLPEQARFLAGDLLRAYASGVARQFCKPRL
jgi:hypothetical protein